MSTKTRHIYASPEWLKAMCELAERHLDGIDLAGCDYVWGEEYLDVPTRVNDTSRIGWHVRIRNGEVKAATEPPPEDADSIAIVDWDATEPFCHQTLAELMSDPGLADTAADLSKQGKVKKIERRERPAALATALTTPSLHDAVVAISAPRPRL